MIFRQVIHDDLGCASYFVGDGGVAAVVDPKLHVEDYLRLARYSGVSIEHVVETHNHADHVSGHGRLAAATGATIHVSRLAGVEYEHEPFDEGWELELGDVVLRAVPTPGHRPEHTSFLVIDRARGSEPWAVLTGDALFVGDTGRPDLAVEPEEGAREIFRSVHERLLDLPPHTEVWPGHLGGSLCGGSGMDRKVASSIGYEREHNARLAAEEEGFVRDSLAELGPQPPRFEDIVARNRGPLRSEWQLPGPLTPRQLEVHGRAGALVVDVRTDSQFDDAHVPGAVSITALRAGFGSKLAWLVERDQEVLLVGRDDAEALEAAELAAAVGIDQVGGYLAGGMTSWREEGRTAQAIERIDAGELHARAQSDPELQIVDVRERSEWDEGHIAGSLLVPYHDLHALPADLDPEAPAAALCSSGQRAGTAASLLRRHGARHVLHVVGGGVEAWERAGGPVER
ncbi:MAG TPA: MBL fold metallo-hydrolase [Thermoleophilaceae bacterium]|nr:MBL fold metallo-hydrolase [Thermoleophilaceae bacterium]